jgi:hypothetical protein
MCVFKLQDVNCNVDWPVLVVGRSTSVKVRLSFAMESAQPSRSFFIGQDSLKV